MMSRWETMAANLPIIQQRLIALNELHQQSKELIIKQKLELLFYFSFSIQFNTFTL